MPKSPSPTRRTRALSISAVALLLLVLTSCGLLTPVGEKQQPLSAETLEILNPQPPQLPRSPKSRPLPRFVIPAGSLSPQAYEPLTADASRVGLKLLIISPNDDPANPSYGAAVAFLDQIGVPYDTFLAQDVELTKAALVTPAGDGRYSGIILATGGLAYEATPGVWLSAFTADEWDLLYQYEREFAVRQLTLYTYPSTEPEDYGLTADDGSNPVPGYYATTTTAGRDVFAYLADDAHIPIDETTYVYKATLKGGSNAVPLLVDAGGKVLAATTVSNDGRERLVLTFDHSEYLLGSQLLGYGLVDWVSRGVFFGQKRYHLDADVDDWFVETGWWDTDLQDISTTFEYEVTAQHAYSFRQQQDSLRLDHPLGVAFTWTMAFNGSGAVPGTPQNCNPAAPGRAGLTAMTQCVADDFNWVNHTWSHEYMDSNVPYYDIPLNEIVEQIQWNQELEATLDLGPGFSPQSLVTGDISGLGWYAPLGPDTGPKQDFGLMASNPNLLLAAHQRGIRYIASNMSTASHEPDCSGCGTDHPMNAGLGTDIFLVPRWPTNVFATVGSAAAAIQAYNLVYGPNGTDPYWDHDLTYQEYLDVEAEMALSHILSGSPYPHYFHTANLNEYEPGNSVLTDWADNVLAHYESYLAAPLISLRWDDFAARVEQITSHHAAAPVGEWDRTAGTIAVSSATGGTILATGMLLGNPADSLTYAGQLQSWRTVVPGGSFSINDAPTVPLPPAMQTQTITFDQVFPAYRFTTDWGIELEASASSSLPVTWTSTGPCSELAGILYMGSTPGLCTITANQAGNATYYAAVPVSHSFQVVYATYPLNVTVDGDGTVAGGTGDAIACPGTCSAELPYDSLQELTATPASGSNFIGWTGAVTASTPTIQVSMTEARSVTATFVSKQSQTITFGVLSDRMANETPFSVTASASSGLTVAFAASGVCSVTGDVVTLSGALGACTVTASQAGDGQYLPAPDVERTFQVTASLYQLQVTVVGSGSVTGMGTGTCTGSCSESLADGSPVSLTATAAEGFRFSGWSGSQASSDATIAFTMSAATSLTATFVAKDTQTIDFPTLTDRLNDVLTFQVTATATSGLPVTFDATGVCSVSGTTVTLTGALGSCTVTASQVGNEQYLAAAPVARSFTVSDATHTLSVAVDGSGTVSGNGIDCPSTCSAEVATGTDADLTATAAPGWRFSHWTGDSSATTPSISLTMSGAASVTAHFVELQSQVITFAALSDLTTDSPGFTVSATASSGLPVSFSATGVCSITGSFVTLSGSVGGCTITANQAGDNDYLPAAPVARTFQVTAAMQSQSITFAPLSDRLNTAAPFAVGATASSGLPVSFSATGVCSVAGATVTLNGQAGTCTVTASQAGNGQYLPATSVSRSFQVTLATYTLSVNKIGAGIGVIISNPGNMGCSGTCSASFTHGTVVTLVPVPVLGSTFVGWSGACSGQGACVVNVSAAKTVTASFARSGAP